MSQQSKILIDTNTYFRLAQSIHPLLKTPFGEKRYVIVITDDLEKEFTRSERLQSKFGWFHQDEYQDNRRGALTLSKQQRKQFYEDRTTVAEIANDFGLTGVSIEDINSVVYALILSIPLVTDDRDMATLAEELQVQVMKTLDLLKLMVDASHITMDQVRLIARYWLAMADCPGSFRSDYRTIFSEAPPSIQ